MSQPCTSFTAYIKNRIDERTRSDAQRIREIKKDYIVAALQKICTTLKIEYDAADFITIRRASYKKSPYLRPVFTQPPERSDVAQDWSMNIAFDYAKSKTALKGFPDENKILAKEDGVFSAIDHPKERLRTPTGSYQKGQFTKRVDYGYKQLNHRFGNADRSCFFCVKGIMREREEGKENQSQRYHPTHILAIYTCAELSASQLAEAQALCTELFEQLDVIATVDAELFRLEGGDLVAELQPVFLRQNLAPADKIAFMIEKLKHLFARHLDLCLREEPENPENTNKSDRNDNKPEVYYVSLEYMPEGDKESPPSTLHPIFQIYPHAYRNELPDAAFRIGHPSILSVSKCLLRHYFESYASQGTTRFVFGKRVEKSSALSLSSKFSNLFREIANKDKALAVLSNWQDFAKAADADDNDMLYLSAPVTMMAQTLDNISENAHLEGELSREVWDRLNMTVRKGIKNQSIIAFVIDGDTVIEANGGNKYMKLPRAILAVESPYPRFLSKSEQHTMRRIVQHLSALVRHLFHDNSLLDYRENLSIAYDGFEPTVYDEGTEERFAWRLLLCSMSIDASLLDSIRKDPLIKKDFEDEQKLASTFYDDVLADTIIADEDYDNEEVVKDQISLRFQNAISYLAKHHPHLRQIGEHERRALLDFLEACPRNFAWAGYAPSLAEALGDRADGHPPRFSLIAPGFSAAGLYMAVVDNEIQQVAKLSSVEKLHNERTRYRDRVRYKLLLAARTPGNGFAFDSTGMEGFEHGENERAPQDLFAVEDTEDYRNRNYGVLVSDLAAGITPREQEQGSSRRVKTLLNEVADTINADFTLETLQRCRSIGESMVFFFGVSSGLWHTVGAADKPSNFSLSEALNKLFRLTKPTEQVFTYHKNGFPEGCNEHKLSYNQATFGLDCFPEPWKIAKVRDSDTTRPPLLSENAKSKICIVHGDLNARNLAWAAAIEHFMVIDFEHTGIGLWGVDQARLAVNLLIELHAGIGGEVKPEFHVGIAETVEWLSELWEQYDHAYGTIPDNILNAINKCEGKRADETDDDYAERKASKPHELLQCIIAQILKTFYDHRGGENAVLKDQEWNRTVRKMLSLAIIKEFEYSTINVKRVNLKPEQFTEINKIIGPEKSGITLQERLKKIFDVPSLQSKDKMAIEQKRVLARYFICYHLLRNTGLDDISERDKTDDSL